MSFFQNVFDFEFRATLFGADRQQQTTYKIPAAPSRSDYIVNYNSEPYDLTDKNILTINYAFDPDLKNYSAINIDFSLYVSDISSVKTNEVINALNDHSTFKGYFNATKQSDKILISPKKIKPNFRVYISNSGAESILKFNKKAPVRELPSYFEKFSIENRFKYPDLGSNRLVLLNPEVQEDADIITEAGFDPENPTPDWKLLKGTNDAFWFYKREYSNGKLSSEIKYPAGAVEGDLAKKTYYVYEESDLTQVLETPYTLKSSDLMIPPN
jgi:hypothetical protein